mgnify:CR=1 FL=1
MTCHRLPPLLPLLPLDQDRTAPALITGEQTISHGQLRAQAASVAEDLAAHGLGPGHGVVLLAERTPAGVATLLGLLQAGCCVIPLDTHAPSARLRDLLGRAAPRAVLAQGHGARRLRGLLSREAPLPLCLTVQAGADLRRTVSLLARGGAPFRPCPAAASHAMFTSGSTGEPKGLVFSRASLDQLLRWFAGRFSVGPSDRMLALAPLHFDISLVELLLPLSVGASACLAPALAGAAPGVLADFLQRSGVTLAYMVASMARGLPGELAAPSALALTRLILTGEPAHGAWVEGLQRSLPRAQLFNLYGATEVPVATLYTVPRPPPPGLLPLGRAVAGMALQLLGQGDAPVAPGDAGEVVVSGELLPLGHLEDEAQDQQRMLIIDGARWLRTGDWARQDADQELHFIGRRDELVKVRGCRVDLTEVDRALGSHPGVTHALTCLAGAPADPELWAAVSGGPGLDATDVQLHCARVLPGYMVPARVEVLLPLPRTSSGKLDRRALSRALGARPEQGEG